MSKSDLSLNIGDKQIGANSVFFIAEAGINHNGELHRAKDLIDVAVECGADAVKFQTFKTEDLVTKDAPTAEYQTTDGSASQYELLQAHELSKDDFESLQSYCAAKDITFLSTPFDLESANILDELEVPAIKLGSGELTNHPLLRHVTKFGKPLIISTGMATMTEVEEAVSVLERAEPEVEFALLHCTSTYPAKLSTVNLRAMNRMVDTFEVPVGYSDHTKDVSTPAYATAAGALIIEKHFTLDQSLPGPDHTVSLMPAELDRAVSLARDAAVARGTGEKRPTPDEKPMRQITRKSLHAACDLAAGTILQTDHITIKRPADGISPVDYQEVMGRQLETAVSRDEPITEEMLR